MRVAAPARLALACAAALACLAAPARADLVLPEGFHEQPVAEDLAIPTDVAFAPDRRAFVTEKAGLVRVVGADGRLDPEPLLDLTEEVNSRWDRGLLGIAVDPAFATTGHLYLLYVADDDGLDGSGPQSSRLTRFTVRDGVAGERRVIVGTESGGPCPPPDNDVDCVPADAPFHPVGTVVAAPDGTLWLGSGDATDNGTFPTGPADERSLAGKVLHVDAGGRGLPGHAFCPEEDDLTRTCTKLHAKGLRNPFRFSLRPGGGIAAGDVGWRSFEELNLLEAGRDYGWPCFEGPVRTPQHSEQPACQAAYARGEGAAAAPDLAYGRDVGRSIIGGPEYAGTGYPAAYRGSIFYGDYAGAEDGEGWIARMTPGGPGVTATSEPFATGWEGGVALRSGPDGDLVHVALGTDPAARAGVVRRIVHAPGNLPPVAALDAAPAARLTTVAVDAKGSSDPDGDELSYEWDFGDGTPLASGLTATHTYAEPGSYRIRLLVSDARGLRAARTQRFEAANTAPVLGELSVPERSRGGEPIALRGTASDAEDGPLAVRWDVTLVHGEHNHPLGTFPDAGEGVSFVATPDHDADSYHRVTATAVDRFGSVSEPRTFTVLPQTTTLRLLSTPPGAQLTYDGTSLVAPVTREAAVGFATSVGAAERLVVDGEAWTFARWADGGPRVRALAVPGAETTLTAVYAPPPRDESAATARAGEADPAATTLPPAAATALPLLPEARASRAPVVRRVTLRAGGRFARPRRVVAGAVRGLRAGERLELALGRRDSGGCRWWRDGIRRLGGPGSCARPAGWVTARTSPAPGGRRFRVRLSGRLPAGAYVVRGRPQAG